MEKKQRDWSSRLRLAFQTTEVGSLNVLKDEMKRTGGGEKEQRDLRSRLRLAFQTTKGGSLNDGGWSR